MTTGITVSHVSVIETVTISTRVSHQWGHQPGDVTEYVIGRRGGQMWIQGKGIDLTGPQTLLLAIAEAITDVAKARA